VAVIEAETLGVLAHRGGLLVERPELSVGVVRAVSRPSGLEVELLARRPPDGRSATERQADIRAGRGVVRAAQRRLLPAFDEGMDLRAGWLDDDGRPHWEYGSRSSSSGDAAGGGRGPSLRTVLALPPLFDRVSMVLAWPEIGFPETVVDHGGSTGGSGAYRNITEFQLSRPDGDGVGLVIAWPGAGLPDVTVEFLPGRPAPGSPG